MYEPTDRVATYYAEQPQDQENYKNRPKHFFFPSFCRPRPSFVGTKAIAVDFSNEYAVSVFEAFSAHR
jgi:hypothetical protein